MEKIKIEKDIKTIGKWVSTFPLGIGETFDSLAQNLGLTRNYYGVSWMEGNGIHYLALAEEKTAGEASRYGYEKYVIEKGEYLAIELKDWRNHLNAMEGIFGELMKDQRTDKTKPCVEWYKDDYEMLCMMLIDPAQA